MILTKATEEGIQLECGILLNDEDFKKVTFNSSKEFITRMAKDFGVNVIFGAKESDFRIMLGTSLPPKVTEEELEATKEKLNYVAALIENSIENFPDTEEKVQIYIDKIYKINSLTKEYIDNAKSILGKDTIIDIRIEWNKQNK